MVRKFVPTQTPTTLTEIVCEGLGKEGRNKMNSRFLAAVLVAVILLAVAGCIPAGGTATPPPPATSTPAPSPTPSWNWVVCEWLLPQPHGIECWVGGETGPEMISLLIAPGEAIWPIPDESEYEHLTVYLAGQVPTWVVREWDPNGPVTPGRRITEWPLP